MARRIGIVVALLAFVMALPMLRGTDPTQDRGAGPAEDVATTIAPADDAATSTSSPAASVTVSSPPRVATSVPVEPGAEPAPPPPGIEPGFTGVGYVVVAAGGADLADTPGGPASVRAREGLVFPALERNADWIRVLTTCDDEAWVNVEEVAARAPGVAAGIGRGFALEDAVVVVDAGHGGPNIGTSSPDGSLLEKAANIDIARRVRDLLENAHSVDWDTGTIYEGDDVAAVRRVILTRVGAGDDADYEAGLVFRAQLANSAGAHAMVSIHNNAGWEIELDHPGSDVYYQSQLGESRRLAELLVEEFQRSFVGFDADWVGAIEWGAKSRLSPRDGESQYYGLLRRAEVPSVIAEGAYLANPSEAVLLATPEFRQAYAEAVYRALVRFLTTDETAATPTYDPIVWSGFAGSGDPVDTCEVPSQP